MLLMVMMHHHHPSLAVSVGFYFICQFFVMCIS